MNFTFITWLDRSICNPRTRANPIRAVAGGQVRGPDPHHPRRPKARRCGVADRQDGGRAWLRQGGPFVAIAPRAVISCGSEWVGLWEPSRTQLSRAGMYGSHLSASVFGAASARRPLCPLDSVLRQGMISGSLMNFRAIFNAAGPLLFGRAYAWGRQNRCVLHSLTSMNTSRSRTLQPPLAGSLCQDGVATVTRTGAYEPSVRSSSGIAL